MIVNQILQYRSITASIYLYLCYTTVLISRASSMWKLLFVEPVISVYLFLYCSVQRYMCQHEPVLVFLHPISSCLQPWHLKLPISEAEADGCNFNNVRLTQSLTHTLFLATSPPNLCFYYCESSGSVCLGILEVGPQQAPVDVGALAWPDLHENDWLNENYTDN